MILWSRAINVKTMVYDNAFCSDSRKIGHNFERKEAIYHLEHTNRKSEVVSEAVSARYCSSDPHVPEHNTRMKSLLCPLCGEGYRTCPPRGIAEY